MKLHTISIIPIELYTLKRRTICETNLLKSGAICASDNTVSIFFTEISDDSASVYTTHNNSPSTLVVFHKSSCCLCVESSVAGWQAKHNSIVATLKQRNELHKSIISNKPNNPIFELLGDIRKAVPNDGYGEISSSYVFSFYIVEKSKNDNSPDKHELLKLVDPSMLDMDDMLSTDSNFSDSETGIKSTAMKDMHDVDISNKTVTFVSWATVVSVTDFDVFEKTKTLLTGLEIRLQMTWNKCYCVSQYAAKVFDSKTKSTDISELFWSFSHTLDDAKSTLTSTLSSRADNVFKAMVETSKIEGEIIRLEQKVNLLEKYINQANETQNRKYQKAIELLLFIVALASLFGVFFPLPIVHLNNYLGGIIIAAICIGGFFAIFKRK